ncbi:MAG: HAMP domain-containing histidine kinase [Deltaproteobacteria bacterium]|nr:HAMP domain-containing histidine kinase [Deltaproteobacteria bacterium]MBN2673108.1 HAMP domain-containing histidine kinase [Deltaproteobacteria bacterium]
MLRSLARNAIFILFPVILAAIVILGKINFEAAQNFGRWGERSIVESTFLLAKEKVDRVENEIISTDNAFFQIIDAENLNDACTRWSAGIHSNLVKAAVIFTDDNEVVQYFHRNLSRVDAQLTYELLLDEIIPNTNFYESMYQHKHYHWAIDKTDYLITTFTEEYESQIYTSLLLYDTDVITGEFFSNIIEDVGNDRVINVEDARGHRLFGDDFGETGDFSVAKRFPSTLYKWKLQLAPISAAFYTQKAQKVEIAEWMLIPASFGIIVFGIIVLAMVWVRERRLNTLKSEFISNTSHELKTPLALIKMFSELLAMKQVKDPEKVARYHEIILKETERLTALIDNVLDFSRIERGKNVYYFETLNPKETISTAIDIYRHRVEAMGATLTFSCSDDIPNIKADQDAVTLVLLNLIDNAIKYAVGTDVIGVEMYTRGKYLFLDVYDRGQGIPASHLKRIFERFYRYKGSDEESNKQRGSGIGLSLVKHIAKAHGGYATVSSTPGVETRFSVRFPLRG